MMKRERCRKRGSTLAAKNTALWCFLNAASTPVHYNSKGTPNGAPLVLEAGVSHSPAGLLRGQLWSPTGAPFTTAPGSTPAMINIKNKDRLKAVLVFGAGSGGRTRTVSPPRDFEFSLTLGQQSPLAPVREVWGSSEKPLRFGTFSRRSAKM